MSKNMMSQRRSISNSRHDGEDKDNDGEKEEKPAPSRKKDITLNFAMFALPMIAIPLVFLAFVYYTREHPVFREKTIAELPTVTPNIAGKYTTLISATAFVLIGSWTSNAAQFIMAPFMFLFSFIIAKAILDPEDESLLKESRKSVEETSHRVQSVTDSIAHVPWGDIADDIQQHKFDDLAKGIAKAVYMDIWDGVKSFVFRRKHTISHAARVATIGGVTSAIFTQALTGFYKVFDMLTMTSDTFLHLSVSSLQAIVYDDVVRPDGSHLYDDYTMASFVASEDCLDMLQSPVTTSGSNTLPCSLNQTDELLDLADVTYAYAVLDEGISEQTGNFYMDQQQYLEFSSEVDEGFTSDIQVIAYADPQTNLSHALLFNMTAASVFSSFPNGTADAGGKSNLFGTDFAASTVSMVTKCVPATQACGMHNSTQDQASGSNDLSIPFNCSPIFSGDVWEPPTDGLEQFRGWHTVFFDNSTGVAEVTSASSQLNPFYFNATAALTSVEFSTLEYVGDPQVPSGAVVDAGDGRVALALTCKSTVYNVNYSVVNYQMNYFNAVIADPQLASIMKAPLQVGFGRHELYIQAQIGIMLNDNLTVAYHMETAFSQIGIALASGAFDTTRSYAQRVRYQTFVTIVSASALWFIVVVCFVYAAIGMVFAAVAFAVHRNDRYTRCQAQIVPTSRFSITDKIKDMVTDAFGKMWDLAGSLKPGPDK